MSSDGEDQFLTQSIFSAEILDTDAVLSDVIDLENEIGQSDTSQNENLLSNFTVKSDIFF